MDFTNIQDAIAHMRTIGNDTQAYEVKSSARKLPNDIIETLSAFSNGKGGIIILGLAETDGFLPVKDFNAPAMRDALAEACSKLTPVVRPDIEIMPFEGTEILVAEIPTIPITDRPCYITARGLYNGSFIRTGDGDRKLTHYEINRMIEEHRQPQWDAQPVPDASIEDLDPVLVEQFILRQKQLHPRIFSNLSEENVLQNMRVIAKDGDIYRPTMAGLLALGTYPQKYFPRLVATFAIYPDIQARKLSESKELRFTDNQTMVGAIPYIVQDIVDAVRRNMRTGAVIEGAFRKDLPDYPIAAVREAIVNAMQHRDYSEEGQASPVHVAMYPDRLQITNPGGLYGNVTIETLGKAGNTATRNRFLSSILETTPLPSGGFVVENRGSGIPTIKAELDEAEMFPADIQSTLTHFSITFLQRRHTISETKNIPGEALEQAILDALEQQSSISTAEIIAASGLSRATVNNRLRKLVEQGRIEPTQPPKSPKQRYRIRKSQT